MIYSLGLQENCRCTCEGQRSLKQSGTTRLVHLALNTHMTIIGLSMLRKASPLIAIAVLAICSGGGGGGGGGGALNASSLQYCLSS